MSERRTLTPLATAQAGKRLDAKPAKPVGCGGPPSEPEYKVGPGRPPKEYQFKPGQSGNPKGAKRKPRPILLDLKAAFERAFNKKLKLTQGERVRIITIGAAGIEQLAAQYAKGDRHARRDAILYAEKFGVDLLSGHREAIVPAVEPDQQAILDAYVARRRDAQPSGARVFAPPELLDDDCEGQSGS